MQGKRGTERKRKDVEWRGSEVEVSLVGGASE